MEILFSVENFEESNGNFREINSPRTLEACLRSGLDPSELYPKTKAQFNSKTLTKEMVDIKYEAFEKKRLDKIHAVKTERNHIVMYAERKQISTNNTNLINGGTAGHHDDGEQHKMGLVELEERRIEALRKRQEKELSKIVEREQTMVALQQKIKRAEDEEVKKKKIHEKKVAELKIVEEKKRVARAHELKRLEAEEAEKKREMERKEAIVQEKIKKARLAMEKQMAKEARERDEERKQKVEEFKQKTEALLKAQADEAERNRLIMLEREHRIMSQLEAKKEAKREEVAISREKATKRIEEALEKHHEIHEVKKQEFNKRQKEAEVRAKENAVVERERLKKQAQDREKRNDTRLHRLIDAYKIRADHRQDIVDRRNEKDQVYDKVREERNHQIAMMKFTSDLKLRDKLDNVERVARVNEFKRLQTLQKIYNEDHNYESMKEQRKEMLDKHNEEAKVSLIRKHEISDAMERMRMTNDFTLLDKLFASKKKDKKNLGATAKTDEGGEKEEDPRLAQTM